MEQVIQAFYASIEPKLQELEISFELHFSVLLDRIVLKISLDDFIEYAARITASLHYHFFYNISVTFTNPLY